jgi:hypothetical protein
MDFPFPPLDRRRLPTGVFVFGVKAFNGGTG